jgi:hypothetical protein
MQQTNYKLFTNNERVRMFVDIYVVCITPRGITLRLQRCISVLAAVMVVVWSHGYLFAVC